MSECKNCKPEIGECDFCPYSSSGKLNLNERMYGDEPDNIDNCPTFFGINIEKASPEVRKIIQKCIRKEKHPNY